MPMSRRERIYRAMHFQSVDQVPVRFLYTPVGYYEHGEKLNDLYATLPCDFYPFERKPIPKLTEKDFDQNGKYYAVETDQWGVTREFRIFGIQGIPSKYLLNEPEDLLNYKLPPFAQSEGPSFESHKAYIQNLKENDYHAMDSCGELYQLLIALYGDENVLCDMVTDEYELNYLADQITEYNIALMNRAIKAGADSVAFCDDYGTERSLIMGPETWRRFFKPRLKKLFRPAVDAGIDIHFHSCGQVMDILPDLKELGVTSIWPQLPAYNMEALAKFCREVGLAVEVHTDRARTMTYGTPSDVKELVKREFDTFRMMDGGAWFFVETDNGFPFENIEVLIETIREIRG